MRIKTRCLRTVLLIAVALAGPLKGSDLMAADLMDAYRLALAGDPVYLAARATAQAGREAVPQAMAGLLPQIVATGSRSHNSTAQTNQPFGAGVSVTQHLDYPATALSLSLRQPLLRLASVATLRSAEAQVAAAEATLLQEQQAVVLRVAGAYFDVLVSREKVRSVLAQKDAYRAQLAAAERSFATGFGTRTDTDDARARFDLASALEIETRHNLRVAERALSGIVNQRMSADAVAAIDPSRLRLEPPVPADLAVWMARAEEQNPELQALRSTIGAAEKELDKTRAAHLPTLDLVASRSKNESDTNTSIGSRFLTSSIGVQFNVLIYSGGGVDSAVRQALANLDKVRQQYETGRRQIELEVAKQYGAVEKGIARVRALEHAERSAQQSVISSIKGVEAGTRNSVDVLNALQQVSATRQELVQARYMYAFDRLKLKAAAGSLGESDVIEINGWMTAAAR